MKKLRIIFALIVIVSVGLTFLFSQLSYNPQSRGAIATAISVFTATFSIGSSILFFMALRGFKPELKAAYRLLAWSALCLGIGNLMFPIIDFYNLWGNKLFNLATYLPNGIAVILLYVGIKKFYTRVGLGGWPSRLQIVVPVILLLGFLHSFLPVSPAGILPNFPWLIHDIWLLIPIGATVLYTAMTVMAFRLKRKTGQTYSKAFGWLGMAVFFFIWSVMTVIILDTFGYDNLYFKLGFTAMLPNFAFVFTLIAGYYFNAIAFPGEQGRGLIKRLRGSKPVTSFEIISFVAGMTADSDKIDPKLDTMRIISSRTNAENLSAADQAQLKDLYLEIERQLAEEDPLRDFSKEQLRSDIQKHFKLDIHSVNTFWPMLSQAPATMPVPKVDAKVPEAVVKA